MKRLPALLILVFVATGVSACGVRNAPIYDYSANNQEQYSYAPQYQPENQL